MPPPEGPVPETICPLPWLNLSMDVNGSSRPCCKFAQPSADSAYQLTNLRDGGLEQVWNGEAMQRLRRDFRAGEQPGECSSCWNEESAGIPSFRQTYLAHRGISTPPDYDDVTPDHPAALDLKLTNACNLKCRICGPVASSLWLREELSISGDHPDPYLVDNKDYFRANKITHDADNLATFRRWLPHLDHLELTGGEPMLSRENREILELIVAEGRPDRMTLLLTTNAAVVDERILELLPAFAKVVLTLSIDDIGPRFEYERAPGRWPDTEAIVDRYAAMASSRLQVSINCSVSPFNVWYLPELVEWLAGRPGLEGVHLNLNLVHYPRHYCIQVLPRPLKDAVARRLGELLVDRPEACPPGVVEQIAEVIGFMDGGGDDEAEEWEQCLRVTRHRDEVRGEHLEATFPEFADQIARLVDGSPGRPPGTPPVVSSGARRWGRAVALRMPRRRPGRASAR